VTLHLEVALTEYALADSHDVFVESGEFQVSGLGICGLRRIYQDMLMCRVPFVTPLFVATFDSSTAKCPKGKSENPALQGELAHFSTIRQQVGNFGSGIDPLDVYMLPFFTNQKDDSESSPVKQLKLCPGDVFSIASPRVSRKVRMEDHLVIYGTRLATTAQKLSL
jgi:hypothetical protein